MQKMEVFVFVWRWQCCPNMDCLPGNLYDGTSLTGNLTLVRWQSARGIDLGVLWLTFVKELFCHKHARLWGRTLVCYALIMIYGWY